MLRTGQQYLDDVKGRKPEVYMGGERIDDVAAHPAFRNIVQTTAQLYDVTSDPSRSNELSYFEEETGERCSNNYLKPRTREDLLARGRAHQAWSDVSWGLYGRSPDHVAGWITGMACVPEVARTDGRDFEAHVVDYYRRVRDGDLFVTYAIVPPAATRSVDSVFTTEKNAALDPRLSGESGLHTIGEDDAGMTVWGFKILATAAVLADEILVGNFQVLAPGMERFAATFTVPTDAPGVKLISRRSFEQDAPSQLDDPLAWRFDETDCVVFFDNVHVPWGERVRVRESREFAGPVPRNPGARAGQLSGPRPAPVEIALHPRRDAQSRGNERHRPGAGRARHAGRSLYPCRDARGGCSLPRPISPRRGPTDTSRPTARPCMRPWTGPCGTTRISFKWFGNFWVRTLFSSLPTFPSSTIPRPARCTARSSWRRPRTPVERYKLMRLVWDLVGSEFASRHIQYEMFYNGPRHVGRTRASHYFRWDVVEEAAQRALDEMGGYDELVEKRVRDR